MMMMILRLPVAPLQVACLGVFGEWGTVQLVRLA